MKRNVRHAFTLIELLVVVAIIAALIAILLPSMGRAMEISRRASCGSNQKQLYIAALGYAIDNQRRFQPLHRVSYTSTGVDHVTWISDEVYDYHRDKIQIDLETFACPNRGEEFIVVNNSNARTGYYFLYGRNMSIWNQTIYEPWKSPQSMTDTGDGVMFGDIIERFTFTPAVTSASHTPRGVIYAPAATNTVVDIGSEGGNLGHTDGSVRWTAQPDMKQHAASTGALVLGYW